MNKRWGLTEVLETKVVRKKYRVVTGYHTSKASLVSYLEKIPDNAVITEFWDEDGYLEIEFMVEGEFTVSDADLNSQRHKGDEG